MIHINYLFATLWIIIILLFCLFSPNIVYLTHKHHFNWKENNNNNNSNGTGNTDANEFTDEYD